MISIAEQIATELQVKAVQIVAAINLLDNGATVPFIARYRKEATQGLNDNHLRHLDQRLTYLRDFANRRRLILTNIEQQGKLTPKLKARIMQANNKTRLEDLYLSYRPKRRTKGQIAIEAGLEPLADKLFKNWQLDPIQEAATFINGSADFKDENAALEGASFILMERIAENADLLAKLRKHILKQAHLRSSVAKGKEQEATKYRDYFEHSELLKKVPPHRALAMFRGRNENLLQLNLVVDPHQEKSTISSTVQIILDHYNLRLSQQPAAAFLTKMVRSSWQIKLKHSLETELFAKLKEQAERASIKVFATNLNDLLMAAPAGAKITLGLDPGQRTGCKLAVVSTTGKLLHTCTIFPHAPQNHWDKSVRTITNLCLQFKIELIAIGNGTASRESDKLVAEAITVLKKNKPTKMVVSEAGASVYSASEIAANEFPELDVSIRGAVSIARRLQDPLAELVKIDPKSIGVGQYQHDVSQSRLSQSLDNVIEDCVNAVGVDLNSASAALLARVSGLNKIIAQNIVSYRNQQGRFNDRKELKKVSRLGAKAFEQAAGFLRIIDGKNPLDQSAVHPESYAVVEKIITDLNSDITSIIGNIEQLASIDITAYFNISAEQKTGRLTLKDILKELEKPARDPRPEFKTASFKENINSMADLKEGMLLEGIISNVANFGAFVDIGVHQDGLVHISSLTNKFVSDPHEIVKAGDIVKVKVLEIDIQRKRISLTMRIDEQIIQSDKKINSTTTNINEHAANRLKQKSVIPKKARVEHKPKEPVNAAMENAFENALAKFKK